MGLQLIFRTYTRLHQHFRRFDRTKRQHRLTTCREMTALAIDKNLDSGHALAIEDQTRDQGIGQHRQVWPR